MGSNRLIVPAYVGSIIMTLNGSNLIVLTGTALLNISSYGLIVSNNYRSILNYVVVSSISFILITLGLSYIGFLTETGSWIALGGIAIKLSMFPFSAWSLPIYSSLNIQVTYWLIMISKIVYVSLITNLGLIELDNQVLIYMILVLTLGSLATINIVDLLGLIVVSGSVQIVYILLPIITENTVLAEWYFVIYIILSINLLLLFRSDTRVKLGKYGIYSILYAFSGIPPFIGFYTKLLILSDYNDNFLILVVILSSVLVSYLYFNMADRWYSSSHTTTTFAQLSSLLVIITLAIYALPILTSDLTEIMT